ncbi:MAG: tetratricopeptide repeat protein [Rudaea sp.]
MSTALLAQAIDDIATLIERGDFAGAERRAQDALQSAPPHAEIWRLLAVAQLKLDKVDAAMRALQQARRLDPRSVEVLCNMATVEILCGKMDAAQRTLRQALALAPEHAGALNGLGRLRHHLGDYDEAAACFERCLSAYPEHVDSWLALANARLAQFQWGIAEAHVRRALSLSPRSADAWYLLGLLFERQGRLADALQPYRTSMQIHPRAATAHNLGLVLDQLGEWQSAARAMEQALQLQPDLFEALGQLVFIKRRLCDWNGLPALAARLLGAVDARVAGLTPFSCLAEDATPVQQLVCARTFARQFENTPSRADFAPGAFAREGLRVGFVSSGFAEHATGLLLVELIERLRDAPLQTIAFATTRSDGSALRGRIEAGFDEFHDVSQQPPALVAETIRNARIDILLDIDGYCMNSRPRIFALKPAPVQISWLAYPGSLGAPWYDYLIADRFVIPAAQREYYDEKIAWLPRCYQPTDATRMVVDPPSRVACGLPAGGFVYCCFNNTWKVTPRSFALWMRILHAVPDSVLWLLDGPPGNGIAERLRIAAQAAGIDAQRLIFTQKLKHADYLARYRNADLFLDTNPYNAHTTASDALYAGCPLLTRPGETFASRVAGSLNHQLDLDEMNVGSDDAYVARAVELATQPDRLASLRARLHDPTIRSRLFDMQVYAGDFAALLARIAEHARRGATPIDISL